jgi:hypothetical protein
MHHKTSLPRAFLLAGLVAVAGVAQAETFDTPQQAGEVSTMTDGAPNLLTTNSPYSDNTVVVDTTVMGAAPASVTTITYPTTISYPAITYPAPVVVAPNTDTTVTYVHRPTVVDRNAAAATFDVPARAGEASTMTGGAPNMVTNNDRVILQSSAPVVTYLY